MLETVNIVIPYNFFFPHGVFPATVCKLYFKDKFLNSCQKDNMRLTCLNRKLFKIN